MQDAPRRLAKSIRLLFVFYYLPKAIDLSWQKLPFHQMSQRWGSCTHSDAIILNPYLIEPIPYTQIDYVVVHESCHTKVKSLAKEFLAER